ncbi:MAG TPA: phosphoribosylanthranilate isomerase [Planctomycetaceae bacterium]|jgi:phosphoribosylanthranilate isomerase|nr:phosphoribosylanthranilate isomerase [Planctomycetaceae bacterium]
MWIKICGLTDPKQARALATLRPDAIGLNFYAKSPRFVSTSAARKISDAVGPQVERIGVFVEPSSEELRRTVVECGLSGVQVHSADEQHALADMRLDAGAVTRRICGFQVGAPGLSHVRDYLKDHPANEWMADACLADALVQGMFGGTGKIAPWQVLRDDYRRDEWPPLILAGGLRPENVAEGIATVRPWGVDVASGVESSPGIKDLERVARFILEARRAFAELERGRPSPVA